MFRMTVTDFRAVLDRIYPNLATLSDEVLGLPERVSVIVENIFLGLASASEEDIGVLREQLLHLRRTGTFNFKE